MIFVKGIFYNIGVGPGDPELITIKAQKTLAKLDVLCVPKSKLEKDSVAFCIVRDHIPGTCEVVEILMPMTRDEQVLDEHWLKGAQTIFSYLKEDKKVGFIQIGDPSIYSTGTYIIRYLKQLDETILMETIPGITSFCAASARVNLPLAESTEPLVIIPDYQNHEELNNFISSFPNNVLLKVASHFPEVFQVLKEQGLENKGVFISRCGQESERIEKKLDLLLNEKLDYLSLMIVKRGGL